MQENDNFELISAEKISIFASTINEKLFLTLLVYCVFKNNVKNFATSSFMIFLDIFGRKRFFRISYSTSDDFSSYEILVVLLYFIILFKTFLNITTTSLKPLTYSSQYG